MTYTVVVPSDQSTEQEFASLKKAKKYAKTLPVGTVRDDRAVVVDGVPGRVLRVLQNGRFDYADAPESWKK